LVVFIIYDLFADWLCRPAKLDVARFYALARGCIWARKSAEWVRLALVSFASKVCGFCLECSLGSFLNESGLKPVKDSLLLVVGRRHVSFILLHGFLELLKSSDLLLPDLLVFHLSVLGPNDLLFFTTLPRRRLFNANYVQLGSFDWALSNDHWDCWRRLEASRHTSVLRDRTYFTKMAPHEVVVRPHYLFRYRSLLTSLQCRF
jgi:hypothetical protein